MGLFNRKDERHVYELLDELCAKVVDCVGHMKMVVDCFHRGDFAMIEAQMQHAMQAESQADMVKAQIRTAVSEGPFMPQFRSDVLELTKRIERTADGAESAAKIFWICSGLLKRSFKKIPREVRDNCLRIANDAVEIAELMKRAVGFLKGDISQIKPLVKSIGEKEDDADAVEDETIKLIVDKKLPDFLSIELISIVRTLTSVVFRANGASHVLTYLSITKE